MKKKILFVINTLGAAGAERALLTLLKKLDPGKYEIALYVLLGQGELAEELPPYVHLKNRDYCDTSVLDKSGTRHMVKTVLKAMFRRGTVFVQFPYLCRNLFAMLKCKKVRPDKLLWRVLSDGGERFAEEYDLAVAFLEGGATYYVADHVKAKKKAAFVHIDYTRAGYTRRLDKDCYQKFDAIFPIGENVKKQFLAVYPEYKGRTRIFHNQIDQSELVRRSKLAGGFTDTFDGIRILTVGRLTAQKAHSVAVETLALLKEEKGIPPVRWYILGEGPERQHLERQIAKAGLTEDFILPGAVENPCPYYVQTDLYVHITAYEGKSIAIQEAQTLGCAIIASENNWEQIDDGNDGVLCRCTAKDAKDAILYLIQHSEKREQLRQNVKKRTIEYEDDMELLYALL